MKQHLNDYKHIKAPPLIQPEPWMQKENTSLSGEVWRLFKFTRNPYPSTMCSESITSLTLIKASGTEKHYTVLGS